MKRMVLFCLLLAACLGIAADRRAVLLSAPKAAAAGGGGGTTPDILHWPLNDGSGSTITASVGPNGSTDGTLNSDYLALNGTSQEAQSDSAVTYGSTVITVMAWIYVTDWNSGSENVIWESGPNYGSGPVRYIFNFQANTANVMIYQSGGGRIRSFTQAGESLANNTWYHFAVVYNNDANSGTGEIKVYKNGSIITTADGGNTKSGTGNFAAETLNIGARNAAGSRYGGRIDDLRIYGSEKDSTFISNLYSSGRP